ncbi:MAG: hypothetical protein HC804_07860 [Anaerolineae bacterium]|nr:hypothetical protein [Anaerolineae bacterium]
MKKWFVGLVILISMLLAACGGSADTAGNASGGSAGSAAATAKPTAAAEIDAETGLVINPNPAPKEGEFIVIGPASAVNVIPQDKPLFTIKIPGGASYTINSQPVSEIYAEDGSQLRPHEFKAGMILRATVRFDTEAASGSGSGFRSDDLTIMLDE